MSLIFYEVIAVVLAKDAPGSVADAKMLFSLNFSARLLKAPELLGLQELLGLI